MKHIKFYCVTPIKILKIYSQFHLLSGDLIPTVLHISADDTTILQTVVSCQN